MTRKADAHRFPQNPKSTPARPAEVLFSFQVLLAGRADSQAMKLFTLWQRSS